MNKNNIKDIHSLIIGGTRGIGRTLVKTLSSKGHIVSVIGRHIPEIMNSEDSNIHYWSAELTDYDRLSSVLSNIIRKNGKLNYLICLQRYRGKNDNWSGEIETTLSATKHIIEKLSDKFKGRGDRAIVLMSSITVQFVVESQPLSYHIGKAGIDQMIRYFAVTLGPYGLRVNGVSLGTILKDRSKNYFLKNETLHNLYKTIIPLRRIGTAEDICSVITFLCSPQASFITGQTILVDGGLTIQWQETLALKLKSISG